VADVRRFEKKKTARPDPSQAVCCDVTLTKGKRTKRFRITLTSPDYRFLVEEQHRTPTAGLFDTRNERLKIDRQIEEWLAKGWTLT
jgi:hypothetical protein